MAPRKPMALRPNQPNNPRITGPWPFPNQVTTNICRHAGRQASAVLNIALSNTPNKDAASAALQAIYYEPFSYWDWHGVHPDDESAFEQQKQLIWERERGFTVGMYGKGGYPTPKAAWGQFRALVDTHKEREDWVKRIAVARWMTVVIWVGESSPSCIC
jgi:hypothetical protein